LTRYEPTVEGLVSQGLLWTLAAGPSGVFAVSEPDQFGLAAGRWQNNIGTNNFEAQTVYAANATGDSGPVIGEVGTAGQLDLKQGIQQPVGQRSDRDQADRDRG
jgi:hypothetical protein